MENEDVVSGTNELKKYNVENINFGIIDTPKIELGFEKVMTNIRVTNTSGQVIIDANPGDTTQNVKYVSNLDSSTNHLKKGSNFTKIEINDEEIYGAKLEITYAITIINNSDVNYYEMTKADDSDSDFYGYYYMFGDHETADSKEVNITIYNVKDYLDKKLTILNNDHTISSNDENELQIKDWKPLYSRKGTEEDFEDTVTIITTRTLSNTDTDMEFTNKAEVSEVHVTDRPKLVEDLDAHSISIAELKYTNYFKYTEDGVIYDNPSDTNSVTIIPPTGADMMTVVTYIIAAVISGIIITIGIIVIKKKVLDK